MSHVGKGYDINQTFIIESAVDAEPIFSACTALYTTNILSCSGNTSIFLGNGIINFDGSLYTNNDLSATTINASTYYSGGTNLFDIISDLQIVGGTFNSNTDTLTLDKQNGGQVIVTGFTDYYTTGATLIGNTAYFDRNDQLSAYTLNLSAFSSDTYVTGVTFSDNQLIIARNDGVDLNTFINTFTGLTVNGFLQVNSISANTISATTFYGDGSNLTGLSTQDTFITGATYNNNNTFTFTNNTGSTFDVSFDVVSGLTVNGGLTATTINGDGSNISGINFSQLATTAHTHPISEVINLQNNLDSKIDKPASPFLGDYLYYNGVTWVPNQVNIPVSAGAGITLFLSITGSSLPTYEYLSQFPIEINETQETVVVNNNQVLIGKYATEQLGRTVVDPGIWEFNTYASVDIPSTGLTQIIVNVYLLTTGGSETFLFSSSTENITTTAATVYTFSVVEQQYSCNTTDYLVVNYSASTTNNFNTTVTLYHGGSLNYSHIHTPFVTLHNDLAGIQGGLAGQYYHLDSNKYNNLALTNTDNNFSVLQSFNAGLISTTISATTLTVTGNPTNLQYVIINNNLDLFNSQVETNNYGTYGRLRLFRASGTQASPTTPSSGSAVGRLEFGAWNSATSTFIANAKVEASMDATSGGNDLPSRLTFFTTPEGSTTMTERMRINSAGNMRIGGVAMSLSDVINVEGGSVAFQNGYGLRFQSTGGTMYASVYSNNNDTVIKSLGNSIRFKNRSGSSNLMSILDNGFVGVNINTPTEYFHVSGNTLINGGFTADTISATTYQNLPLDIRVTGATYNNNNQFTYTNNTGGTFNVLFNTVSGLTVNGNLSVTGTSNLNGTIISTNLSGSTERMVQVDSGGTFSAVQQLIQVFISPTGATAANLVNTSNWNINGVYTGTTITGTYQGQKHYNIDYLFEAVDDNLWIRLIRG